MAQRAERPEPMSYEGRPSLSTARRWTGFAALLLGLFTILSATTSVGTAVPDIQRSLHADLTQVEWLFDAYLLTVTVFMATFGRLGDLFGRKRLFLIGGILFTLGSAASALCTDVNLLIAARAFTGLGPAMMMPSTLSLVTDLFPPERRGVPMGLWGSMAGVAIGIGPVVGGLIVSNIDWQWVFWASALLAILSIALVWTILPTWTHGNHRPVLDIPGVLLNGGFTFALAFALIEGNSRGWGSPLIVGLLAGSIVLFALFLLRERTAASPLVNLDLFRRPAYSAGILATVTMSFGLLAVFSFMPLFLQGPLHDSALKSGLTLLPVAGAMALFGPVGGFLANRVQPRWPIAGALLLFMIGMLWTAHLSLSTSRLWLAFPLALVGIGLGIASANINTAVMRSVPSQETGSAAGVVATVRQLGSVLGVAVLGAVIQVREGTHFEELVLPYAGFKVSPARWHEIQAHARTLAFVDSLNDAFVVCAAVLALGTVTALFIRHSPEDPLTP